MDKINRTIKFRIWSPKEELFTIIDGNMVGKIGNFIHPSRIELDNNGELFDLHGESVIYQQFTGLLDKTGRGIYEGDIIHYTNSREKIDFFANVTFSEKEARYIIESKMGKFSLVDRNDYYGTFIVVGNIFENPELLN